MFLKVAKPDGSFYDNIAIFFPAQVEGLSHRPVRFGEAFVLVQKGVELNAQDRENIQIAFDRLVVRSYGDEGLYDVDTKRALTDVITAERSSHVITL